MSHLFDLSDKIALVTGGNGGIGLGMARGSGKPGRHRDHRRPQRGKSAAGVARTAQSLGVRAESLACDVSQEAEVLRLFAEVERRHGRLDILVNNAGSTVRKPPQDFSLDEWNPVMDVNLTSAFLCARAACR